MGLSVDECQKRINSRQFGELLAYNNIDPFTIDRAEYSIAILTSLVANLFSKKKKFKAADFLINSKGNKETDFFQIQELLARKYGNNQ